MQRPDPHTYPENVAHIDKPGLFVVEAVEDCGRDSFLIFSDAVKSGKKVDVVFEAKAEYSAVLHPSDEMYFRVPMAVTALGF